MPKYLDQSLPCKRNFKLLILLKYFCYRFDSEEDVIQKANATRNGLAGPLSVILFSITIKFLGYAYTKELGQIYRLTRSIQVGMLGINEGLKFPFLLI